MSRILAVAVCGLALNLGGCSNLNQVQQRALTGGAIGAAAGLVVTAATGGSNLLLGSALGAAGGAAIGAVTK